MALAIGLGPSRLTLAEPAPDDDVAKELKRDLARAGEAMRVGGYVEANRRLAHARTLASTLNQKFHLANLEAAFALYRDDSAAAEAVLAALLPEAAVDPDPSTEFWLHNCLTWVRWSAQDLSGALRESELQRSTLNRAPLPASMRTALRLHALWDRAYLLAERATSSGRVNPLQWPDALEARAEYEKQARPRGDDDGMAVLEAFFALRSGHGAEARAAAERVDPAQDGDVQDLYVIALALEAGGDAAGARALRERIRQSDNVYLMLPIVLRAQAPVAPLANEARRGHFVVGASPGITSGKRGGGAATLGFLYDRGRFELGAEGSVFISSVDGALGDTVWACVKGDVLLTPEDAWSPYVGLGIGYLFPGASGIGEGPMGEAQLGVELRRGVPRLQLGLEGLLPLYLNADGSYPFGVVLDVRAIF